MTCELLEISDLIVDFDAETLARVPVYKQDVVDQLLAAGQHRASGVVAQMPDTDGVLDAGYVDKLLVQVHCEMQRLSEEFQHGRRSLRLLSSLLATIAQSDVRPPYRIVDIGCGTGFVIRWLAAHRSEIPYDVELVGVDFNQALIDEANRLARRERLDCIFTVGNAFQLQNPATLFLSTGVVHHFRGESLVHFFQQHDLPNAMAFAHFDFQPTIFSWPGAWLFHFIRMREPLSKHDGVVSARRAHTADALIRAARCTSFECGLYSRRLGPFPIPRVFQAVVGMRPRLVPMFRAALGRNAGRLEEMA